MGPVVLQRIRARPFVTAQDWVVIIGAMATATVAIIGAVGTVLAEVRKNGRAINGRMTELLETSRTAARAQGKLEAIAPTTPEQV